MLLFLIVSTTCNTLLTVLHLVEKKSNYYFMGKQKPKGALFAARLIKLSSCQEHLTVDLRQIVFLETAHDFLDGIGDTEMLDLDITRRK